MLFLKILVQIFKFTLYYVLDSTRSYVCVYFLVTYFRTLWNVNKAVTSWSGLVLVIHIFTLLAKYTFFWSVKDFIVDSNNFLHSVSCCTVSQDSKLLWNLLKQGKQDKGKLSEFDRNDKIQNLSFWIFHLLSVNLRCFLPSNHKRLKH